MIDSAVRVMQIANGGVDDDTPVDCCGSPLPEVLIYCRNWASIHSLPQQSSVIPGP